MAEKVNISIDLLRNIENSRNVGSVTTLLNLCNFLEITPNAMFENLGYKLKSMRVKNQHYGNPYIKLNSEVFNYGYFS